MRLNIRTKVLLAVSLSLIIIFALITYLSVTRDIKLLQTNLNQQAQSFASLATPPIGTTFQLYQNSGSIRITQQVNTYLSLDPDVMAVRVVSVDGTQLYSSDERHHAAISPALASSFEQKTVKNKKGYVTEVVQPYFEASNAHRYTMVYEISTQNVQKNVNSTIRLIVVSGALILIVSIIATSWLLNTLFVRPLRSVSRSANQISLGDFSQQIVSRNQDEIGDLAASVNKMAEYLKADIVKLRELDKLKTEFMMIASHNLRTPLTVMRGYIEMAEHAESADELRAIIKTVEESVVRLHLLAEDLLTISSLESGGEIKKTPTEDKAFVNSVVEEFKLLATKKGLHWGYTNDIPQTAISEINQANVRSALGNVIDNAIKFTKEGGSVRITTGVANNQLVFSVRDTGIGIAPDEMPKLFTKFHRGTGLNKYDYEGVGIGLYLTKLLIEQHGGRVTVKSEADEGSTFTVFLPLVS